VPECMLTKKSPEVTRLLMKELDPSIYYVVFLNNSYALFTSSAESFVKSILSISFNKTEILSSNTWFSCLLILRSLLHLEVSS